MSLSSVSPGLRPPSTIYSVDFAEQSRAHTQLSSPPLLYSPSLGPVDLNRYVEQIERKRQYNREYYHKNVKPKKEHQKAELDLLRERVAELETQLDTSDEVARCHREIASLTERNNELIQKLHRYEQEFLSTKQALEMSRQRIFDLMSIKADQILPNLDGLSPPS